MINWIRENAGLASIAGALILAVSGGGVAYHQLSTLVAEQPAIQSHIHDTTRHIDPNRDPEKLKSLENRVEQLERQLRWMERRGTEGRRNLSDAFTMKWDDKTQRWRRER